MAITHRTFVLLTFPLCCVSIALMVTALATPNWLVASAVYDGGVPTNQPNEINYGLFTGTLVNNNLATSRSYKLYMTCLADRNVCALSCLATVEERRQQVMELAETGASDRDCIALLQATPTHGQYPNGNRTDVPRSMLRPRLRKFDVDQRFINMGLWASTIAFISLGLLMATLGVIFSVLNTAGNPVEPLLGIMGLFIWNGVAAVSVVITLVLWGTQYATTLVYNAVLDETISGDTSSNGLASLGWSYWILLGAPVMHIANAGLLLYRRHIILTEPPAPTVQLQEDNDGTIFLY